MMAFTQIMVIWTPWRSPRDHLKVWFIAPVYVIDGYVSLFLIAGKELAQTICPESTKISAGAIGLHKTQDGKCGTVVAWGTESGHVRIFRLRSVSPD